MSYEKEIFYRNEDYTVRTATIDGFKKYFIKFNMNDSPEHEISHDIFDVYLKEFNKPLENQRNGRKRHIENGEIDDFIESGELTVSTDDDEHSIAIKCDIDAVLKSCTTVQQRRFSMYYEQDYSYEEIAQMEHCTRQAVCTSVEYVKIKLKKHFREG